MLQLVENFKNFLFSFNPKSTRLVRWVRGTMRVWVVWLRAGFGKRWRSCVQRLSGGDDRHHEDVCKVCGRGPELGVGRNGRLQRTEHKLGLIKTFFVEKKGLASNLHELDKISDIFLTNLAHFSKMDQVSQKYVANFI